LHSFFGHTAEVYSVGIFKDGSDYKIVSAGYDNKLILWSLKAKKILNSYTHNDKLDSIAVSSRYIATCGLDNKILIFDHSLNKVTEIELASSSKGLSFSPDGKLLLAGSAERPIVVKVYDVLNGFKYITGFERHSNLVEAVAFLNDYTVISGGGDNNEIYIWDAYTGKVKRQITGNGKRITAVGINASEIAFGYQGMSYSNEQTNLEYKLILDTFSINGITQSQGFKRINTNYKEYSLTHIAGGDYEAQDAVLVISKNGKEIVWITRDVSTGYGHRCYGFTKDGIIISGGSNGHLTAYNVQGKMIADFIGHTDEIWAIAIDGDTLISGSSDQTIRLWNLKDLKNLPQPAIDNEKLRQLAKEAERLTAKKWTTADIKKAIDSKGRSDMYMKIPQIKPIIGIFITADQEWAAWTNEGFYNASPKGDQYVGWHVNKGIENAAEYYTAKQFRRFLYRPDIIQKTIELGGSKRALDEIVKGEPSIKEITIAGLIKRAPVDVKISDLNFTNDEKAEVSIRLGKNSTTTPERLTLYVNGAQQLTDAERLLKGVKPGDTLKYKITLPANNNTVKVTVENQWAENSNEITVKNPTGSDFISTKNSTLYVVAVGISHYPNLPPNNQLKSPPIDAKSIAAHFQKLEGTLYKHVDQKVLTDDSNSIITSNMVEQALREQTQKAGPLDTTIIFLAGHGVTDPLGSYHFITADTIISGGLKEGTTLDWKRLHSIIDKTMGRRVVIVDTCQAGEVFSENKTDIKKLVKDVHDVNAIIYSGTSRQDSGKETSKGGVFTLSMVSGFEGKAAYETNLLPFLKLKDYVDDEVPRLNRDIMLGLYRAVDVKKKSEEEVINSVQRPVAVVPDGMEKFIIYMK
ncbi:MAG: caspase family protein, partial [Nitrospirae bacterium]|nr:caspase family protein [Nitrospirota bacterium]